MILRTEQEGGGGLLVNHRLNGLPIPEWSVSDDNEMRQQRVQNLILYAHIIWASPTVLLLVVCKTKFIQLKPRKETIICLRNARSSTQTAQHNIPTRTRTRSWHLSCSWASSCVLFVWFGIGNVVVPLPLHGLDGEWISGPQRNKPHNHSSRAWEPGKTTFNEQRRMKNKHRRHSAAANI